MQLNRRPVIVLVIFAIVVLIGLGALQEDEAPEVIKESNDYNVPLGYIAATESDLSSDLFLVTLAEKDINEYCENNGIPWRFNITIKCADGQAQNAHELTMDFADNDTKLVGGYAWSSFLCSGARNIAQDHNMSLFSISSTSPIMAIPDTAFRLCPTDFSQVEPILQALDDFNVSSVLIIYRGDAWGDGLVDEFTAHYNGSIIGTVRYASETTEFARYLEGAEALLQNNETEKPSVWLVSFMEASLILSQADDYPILLNTAWFGTDGSVDDRRTLEDSGEYAVRVKLISPKIAVKHSPEFDAVNQLYKSEFDRDMTFYKANVYDCCWLMAYTVIDANTTDGLALRSKILEVASNHRGITGELTLDENGDRADAFYDLYGYFEVDGVIVSVRCGIYDPEQNAILWDTDLISLN